MCCLRCLWAIPPYEPFEEANLPDAISTRHHANNHQPPPHAVHRGWSVPADVQPYHIHLGSNLNGANQEQRHHSNSNPRLFWNSSVSQPASTGWLSTILQSRGDQHSWRNPRLLSEFHNLKCDPFIGIDAIKLEPGGYLWQGSIEGIYLVLSCHVMCNLTEAVE